jgi:hypothetical protein
VNDVYDENACYHITKDEQNKLLYDLPKIALDIIKREIERYRNNNMIEHSFAVVVKGYLMETFPYLEDSDQK